MDNPLIEQSIEFSVLMVEYYKWMKNHMREFVLSKQVLRSGTSIGANIHEANFAVSRADFIAKMQIALKETHETMYWLEVLERTDYLPPNFIVLKVRCESLKKMLVSTLNTAKK